MVSNEHRALNKDRKLENIRSPWKKIPKFDKRRTSYKVVGPGKKYKVNKRRAHVYSGL
jgi:hypothetical protein